MPKNHPIKTAVYRSRLAIGTTLVLLSCPVQALESVEKKCLGTTVDATVVPLNTTFRSEGRAGDPSQFFRLDFPSGGLITLEVAVPGTAESEPKLDRFSGGCGGVEDPPVAVLLAQTAYQHIWIAEEAGSYLFRVSAQDSRQTLGRYKLTAMFLEEPDAQGFTRSDDEDSDNENMLEIEPDGQLIFPPMDPWRLKSVPVATPFDDLCRRDDLDEHGDTLTCATPIRLGRETQGELRNGWGDDTDIFRLTLNRLQTISFRSTGTIDTLGGIYDRFGNRLAKNDDDVEGGNFRIVKTLSAGTYYLRVEGTHGAEGSYSISVDSRP